jgi:hypothetical protein
MYLSPANCFGWIERDDWKLGSTFVAGYSTTRFDMVWIRY